MKYALARAASSVASFFGRSRTELGRAIGGPPLDRVLRSNFAGLESGPWHRNIKADWLGPFTPQRVPFWTLKLMREDPQLALGMSALKAPFFSIEYRLRGGDPDARAFLENAFHRTPLFTRVLGAILNSLDFGFQTCELIYELRDVMLEVDGIAKGVMPSAYVIDDINDIDPERVSNIRLDEFSRMLGVTFDVSQELGLDKLLHAVHQGEFSNHWGRSQLRRAYNPFYWSNWLYLYLMRYMEQKGNPPLIGTAPAEAIYDPSVDRDQQEGMDAVKLIAMQMAALRGGGAAALPWDPDDNGKNRYSIQELQVSDRSEQFITAINHMQGLKLRALGIPERTMTQDTQTGSFASVSEHVDMYYQVLEWLKLSTIIPALNRVADILVRLNFKSTTSRPYFAATPLSRQGRELVAKLIQGALGVPLTLEDGRSYTPGQLIDFEKTFEEFAIPMRKATEAARKPAAPLAPAGGPPAPLAPKAPSPPKAPGAINVSSSEAPPEGDGSTGLARVEVVRTELADGRGSRFMDAVHESLANARESMKAVGCAVEALGKLGNPTINVTVQPANAPDVKVINRVEAAAPPDVNVNVAPPDVNVNIAPPDVNVNIAPAGGGKKDIKLRLDERTGLPIGATIKPED